MNYSRAVLFSIGLILLFTVVIFPRWNKSFSEAPISWDVSGYYLYLPAIFIYDDLNELAFLPDIIEKYRPTHSPDQAFMLENGHQVMKYPAGMAVLYSPFFFVAHVCAKITDYPADGFSLPYQVAIQLSGVLVAILGIFYFRKILLRYFHDHIVAWLIVLICLGTNFFNYATFDSANVHAWTFTLLAIITHLTILWHENPKLKYAIGIGTCIGLAALSRPTEIVFALVPLLWGINQWSSKIKLIRNHKFQIIPAILIVLVIGFTQLIYWKSVAGEYFVYSYQGQGFNWISPHFPNVFFSYRKGWLVYTPIISFALIGLFFWIRKWNKKLPAYIVPVVIFFLVNTWIISSWNIYWYGGSFGQRAFIPSYLLLAFPFAYFLEWAYNTLWKKIIFTLIFSACIFLNLFQTYQAHWGPWEPTAMNKAYYWRIFLKTCNNPYDKLLLDTNVGFSGEKKNDTSVFLPELKAPKDSTGLTKKISRSGSFVLTVNPEIEFSHILSFPRKKIMTFGKWMSIHAWYAKDEHVPNYWYMPQMVVRFMKGDEIVEQFQFRPSRIIPTLNHWQPLTVDYPIPGKDFDRVDLCVWRPHSVGSLYVDNLEVSVFEE